MSVDFACKKIHLDEVIKCSFGLNKTEYSVFIFLLKHSEKEYYVKDIAEKLKLNRTTVQKAVKTLVEKNLILRKQNNLLRGGYVFIYSGKNNKEIRTLIKKNVYEWYKKVEDEIDKL